MPLEIRNDQPRFRPATLIEPPSRGYLHLSAEVEPSLGGPPFPRTSAAKRALLDRLRTIADGLEAVPDVDRATVYRSVVTPPPSGYARTAAHPARFDVIVLVETSSGQAMNAVEMTDEYQQLHKELASSSQRLVTAPSRCIKCINDVDKSRAGVYLFNYFVVADRDKALEVWDHLAGWYMTETNLDNSTVLEPVDDADYAFVNHANWPCGTARLALRQVKPSFFSFVRANLDASQMGSMPIVCRRYTWPGQ